MQTTLVYKNIYVGPGQEVAEIFSNLNAGNTFGGWRGGDIGVLNVADDYFPNMHYRNAIYIEVGLNDGSSDHSKPYGPANPIAAYWNACLALDFLSRTRKAVFVYCHEGVSRSPFVVALYMWKTEGGDFEEALTRLKTVYNRASPHPKHNNGHMLSKLTGFKLPKFLFYGLCDKEDKNRIG